MKHKGSEWSKWDLHFHTPSSYDYKDKSISNQSIIDEMERNSISVFAVTDHHTIDIERYNELRSIGEKQGITVLPGIEFLSDARGKDPVHFIGIFSECCNLEHVWGQIKHKTDINKVDSEGLKENQVYCDLVDTINLVKGLGGIVTIHAGEKSGSLENITHSLPHGTAQKTEIAKAVDIYELGKESDQDGYLKYVFPNIGRNIPMIICSDNHNIKKYVIKQSQWIKGAPTFEGLKYALNEPKNRFFIGEEPPVLKRVRENKTKYIKSLNIERTGREDSTSVWFEKTQLPLNHELVTIIGHKGSGKSAAADILAMCCDAEHSQDYIFLHKDKFKKKGLADRFSAFVEFESESVTEKRLLNHQVDDSQERLVRYLPQSYFEKVCNEIGKVEAFRAEIEKVVFQYVPIEKRMGKPSFKELIDLKKQSADKEISHFQERVIELNEQIIKLEDLTDPEYEKSLLSKKKIKEEELRVHSAAIPIEITDPSKESESEETKKKKADLKELEGQKTVIENKIEATRKTISGRSKLIVETETLNRDIKNKVEELRTVLDGGKDVSERCGFDINKIVTIDYDEQVIASTVAALQEKNKNDSALLILNNSTDNKGFEALSLVSKLEVLEVRISALRSEFTGEQKAYQEYLASLQAWEVIKKQIEGDAETIDSLNYINLKLDFLEQDLEIELGKLRKDRLISTAKIFSKKSEIKSFYDDIKFEIGKKLQESDVSGLSIASSFHCSGDFRNSILRNIKQNRTGSFYGNEDGSLLLQDELISSTDWDSEDSIKTFLNQLIEYLEVDKRATSKGNEKVFIGDVTKDRRELYSYLFGLKFLEPHYDLQQKGKSLEQLSPGEKGALLLVFYLVLDKEDIPLIIDQPEDNLDNNSVAKVLVPYIKEAKKHRQIIMVTHNPNLAVVADSEQVIKVKIDKEDGNNFSFVSGGIENKLINEQIVEVLEGTVPAFSLRKDKYNIN